jgi:hypothetical protein
MNRSILLFFFVFSSFNLGAQSASFEGNKSTSSMLLQKIVPPSPTATSLGKYGDQQINMFTGTSSVNIPIYEIKTNGFSIPLSLAYSTSGLRVSEAASWVGLGWSLGGTGVITRVVKGGPDGVRNPIDVRTWPLPLTYSNVSDGAWNYIHPQIQSGEIDREPDMFIIKAGKLSVKFYYDLNKRIQTVPYNNNIKIAFDGALDQYTVTDDDGTKYFFGGGQSSEVTNSSNPSYAAYTSSWFLSKIITPVGAQILYNNIKGTNTVQQDQYSETEEVKQSGQFGDCSGVGASGRTTQWSVQTFFPVFLNTIETDQEIVYLTRDITERADMPGDYALTGIKVYSKNSGKYEYNYALNYSYFPQVSTICWGNNSAPDYHQHNLTAICKRLKLDQFIEKGNEANTSGFKTYSFQYSPKAVPSRCSLDQDFWGYYNGAGNNSLLPAVTEPEFSTSTFNATSREANPNYSDAGMLQKIVYPTGGETNFIYEPNEVNVISSGPGFQTTSVGLSGSSSFLENSTTFTITTVQQLSINFTLSDPNLLDQGLQRKVEIIDQGGIVRYFSINNNTTQSSGLLISYNPLLPYTGFPPGTYTLRVSRNYSYSSYPLVPPVGLSAAVTYAPTTSVTVINRKIGGFRIKKLIDKTDISGTDINTKEFLYEDPYFVANIQNADCISNYDRWNSATSPVHTYKCFFKSRTTSSVQPIGSVQGAHIAYGKVTQLYGVNGSNGKTEFYYSTDPDQGGYSLSSYYRPITSYDHRRGNLLSQKDYTASGSLVKVKENTYEYVLKYAGLFSFPFYSRDEPLISLVTVSLIPQKIISFSDFAIPSEWVRIKNSTETVFQGTSAISTINEFSYNNPNFSYPTQSKTTSSNGNIIASITTFPLDYKPVAILSNEEIERKFDTDYQTLFNSFVSCSNAASTAAAINACYTTYQSGYDNLLNNRANALSNYQSTFTTLANATADPILKARYQLIARNKISEQIENRTTKNVSTELSKITNDYKDFSGNILIEKINKSILGNTLENEITVNSYDIYGNILQATPKDGVIRSYLYDYVFKFPIAQVQNAAYTDIAYTSFEADGKGNWNFTGLPQPDLTTVTGKKVYDPSLGTITKTISTAGAYIVSYWSKTGAKNVNGITATTGRNLNGWVYYEHKLTIAANATITVSGTGAIDELKLFPDKALMTTYTYSPLIGMTSQSDANNHINYYTYDEVNRLILIADQDKNIVKKICYNYAGQPENCNLFVNTQQQGTYIRNNCTSCQIGSSVTYSVQSGLYSSTISQADADSKAQADISANGQAYANANGTCTVAGVVPVTGTNGIATKSFTLQFRNNCTGTNYNFTLNASSSNIPLSGIPQGNYTVSFSPVGGGTTAYTYRVNGFTQHTINGFITVDLITSGNQVQIIP